MVINNASVYQFYCAYVGLSKSSTMLGLLNRIVPSVGNTANSSTSVVYWISPRPSLSVALTSPIRTPAPMFSLAVKSRER